MPRHQLTPAERQRGHRLTREDRIKGAQATNAKLAVNGKRHQLTSLERSRGGSVLAIMLSRDPSYPARYRFTSESARSASLKRWALHRIYLAGPEKTYAEVARMDTQRAAAPSPKPALGNHPAKDVAIRATGEATLAAHGRATADLPMPAFKELELRIYSSIQDGTLHQIDPFTLSALKRFRLGPVSPFHLTRSQRGHVDIMRDAGLIERTADDHLALTEKGRQALGEDEG